MDSKPPIHVIEQDSLVLLKDLTRAYVRLVDITITREVVSDLHGMVFIEFINCADPDQLMYQVCAWHVMLHEAPDQAFPRIGCLTICCSECSITVERFASLRYLFVYSSNANLCIKQSLAIMTVTGSANLINIDNVNLERMIIRGSGNWIDGVCNVPVLSIVGSAKICCYLPTTTHAAFNIGKYISGCTLAEWNSQLERRESEFETPVCIEFETCCENEQTCMPNLQHVIAFGCVTRGLGRQIGNLNARFHNCEPEQLTQFRNVLIGHFP